MTPPFPPIELPIIDATIRMFTEPTLQGDISLLQKIHDDEQLSKNERLYDLNVSEKDLASTTKFKALLEAEGVEVEMKEGKNGPIPALAKTDPFMQELLEDEDDRIRSLAEARIDVKSTITSTRSARLLEMAERGALCIYLNYCGAHTRRWSGGDSLNFQNLTRRSDLRRSLQAPDGYLIAAPDQSQGECRLLNWLAGQDDVVDRFRRGEDPYLPVTSSIYNRTITADMPERQVGKVVELACGYGMGVKKLERVMRNAKIEFDPSLPFRGVNAYRATHPAVVRLWKNANAIFEELSLKRSFTWEIFKGKDGLIYHPNGTWLDYRGLRWKEGEWRLYRGDRYRKMYGAKLVENIVQWLSRIVTAEAIVRYRQEGYQVVGMAHDDCWLLIPDDGVDRHSQIAAIMAQTPEWAPGLPLASEVKIGRTYQ